MERLSSRRIARTILLTMAVLGGGSILLLLVWLVANILFDQNLLPEARRWYAQPPRALPADASNGFYAALGARAVGERDGEHSGRELWARIQHAAQHDKPKPQQPPQLELPPLPQCKGGTPCLRQLREKVDSASLIKTHGTLLQRYQALHAYHSISRPLLPANTLELTDIALHPRIARLWQLQQVQYWQQGDAPGVLQEVAADLRLWQNSVNDATTLLDAALASALVRQAYELLAELQSLRPDLVHEHAAQWRQLLASSPTAHHDAQLMLWGELRAMLQTQEKAWKNSQQVADKPLAKWLTAAPFLQKNRSLNQLYRQQLRVQQQLRLPPAQLAGIKDSAGPECEAGLRYAINPIGRIINCLQADNAFHSSIWHLHHAEALRRLLLLHSQLGTQPLKDGPLSVDRALRNPWDGRAPEVKNGRVHFYWPCPNCPRAELTLP